MQHPDRRRPGVAGLALRLAGLAGYATYVPGATIVQVITAPPTRLCNGQLEVDRDIGQSADIGAFTTLDTAPPPALMAAAAAAPWWRR